MKYDWRGNARSTRDRNAEMDMAQAGRDAAAVINDVGAGPAYVFGNSAGANIALKLTEDHPKLVRGLIDYEPPITNILPQPEAGKWRKDAPAPGDQAGGNHDRFLAHEFQHINSYVPSLEALRQGGVPMVTVVGRDSGNAFYARTAHEPARQLPCPCMDIVGNHLGYAFHAEMFADDLHHIIQKVPARANQ